MANPRSLTKEEVYTILKSAGSRTVTPEGIDADIEAGAPVNEDGRMDIIAYAAWILRREQHGG